MAESSGAVGAAFSTSRGFVAIILPEMRLPISRNDDKLPDKPYFYSLLALECLCFGLTA
jgi:hypothetical protein